MQVTYNDAGQRHSLWVLDRPAPSTAALSSSLAAQEAAGVPSVPPAPMTLRRLWTDTHAAPCACEVRGLTHAWVELTHAWVGLTHAWVGLAHAWVGLTHAWVGFPAPG
jgi:hypothetical protein